MKDFLNHSKKRLYDLLRWSERYTKTDMVYLTHGGSWLSVLHGVGTLTTFILAVAFANLIPKETYGVYKYILSIASIISAFTLTGTTEMLVKEISKGNYSLFKPAIKKHVRWNLLSVLITIAASTYYFFNGNNVLAVGILIAGTLSPYISTFSLYGAFLNGTKDFYRKMKYGSIQALVPTFIMIVAAFLTNSAVTLIATYHIVTTLTLGFLFIKIYREVVKKDLNEEVDYRETFRFSKHLSAINVIGSFSFQIDKILLFHFLGATQLAIYSIALAAPQQLRQVSKTLNALVLPKVSNRSLEELRETLPRKAFFVLLLAILLALVYILAAPFIFKIFFNPYLDSVRFSQIYALVFLVLPITLFKDSLVAHSKTKALYTLQAVVPLTKLALLLILLPKYGILGAIIALLGAELVNLVTTYWLFTRARD